LPRSFGGRLALLGALLALSAAVSVAHVTERERDNTFCVSCHGPSGGGARLHADLYARFTSAATPPPDLASAHFRHGSRVDCIDCHGGVGVAGRARVLALAGFDALKYVARWYEEPKGMRSAPLWDRDCTQCHRGFDIVAAEEGEAARIPFHGRVEHHRLPMPCVACHTAHEPGDPRLRYVRDAVALPQCRRCHPGFGEDGAASGGAARGAGADNY
jgi:hypothetical protein